MHEHPRNDYRQKQNFSVEAEFQECFPYTVSAHAKTSFILVIKAGSQYDATLTQCNATRRNATQRDAGLETDPIPA